MNLSIIIPAYQEAERLPGSLQQIAGFLESETMEAEVIVVDDGSSDATSKATDAYDDHMRTIVLPKNRGKGCAVRTGVLASRGDQVLVTDADLSSPIEELTRLRSAYESSQGRSPIIFGSRAVDRSLIQHEQPWYRQTMGKTFNLILRGLGVKGVKDTQCGFKLLNGPIARELFAEMVVDGFAFDVELLLRAQRKGYSVTETAVVWNHVEESRVHPVLHSAQMLWDVLRLRWHLKG